MPPFPSILALANLKQPAMMPKTAPDLALRSALDSPTSLLPSGLPVKIGLLSDTHGHLDPRALDLLRGVAHIIHAGDIGPASIIAELETLAPVTAVLGNCDEAGLPFPETDLVELDGHRVLVHHIVDPLFPAAQVRRLLEQHQPSLVIFGHTHRPFFDAHRGITFVNPGSASIPRHGLPTTLCRLDLRADGVHPEFLAVEGPHRTFTVARCRPAAGA